MRQVEDSNNYQNIDYVINFGIEIVILFCNIRDRSEQQNYNYYKIKSTYPNFQ